jgi:hypothetical protein
MGVRVLVRAWVAWVGLEWVVHSCFDQALRPMTQVRPCQIEALFGSANRVDFDAFSDSDYLIADSDCRLLARRKLDLQEAGFSVSDYSLSRLRRIFERQTLFAAHLKFESRTVFDADGEFSALKAELDPFRDYSTERVEAEELFAPLRLIPEGKAGAMWALDHLSVSFRNLAIITLAQRGKFVYSHEALLSELAQAKGVTPEHLHLSDWPA